MPGLLLTILIIYGLTMVLFPVGLWLYSMRVVLLPGFLRMAFTHPGTGHVTTVLTRIQPSQTEVTFSHGTYDLDDDAVRYFGRYRIPYFEYIMGRAEPIMAGKSKKQLQESVDNAIAAQDETDRKSVERGESPTDPDKKIKPIRIDEDHVAAFSPRVAAIGFKNVARNRATEQLIASFTRGMLTPGSITIIGFVILGLVMLALGFYQVNEIWKLQAAQGLR